MFIRKFNQKLSKTVKKQMSKANYSIKNNLPAWYNAFLPQVHAAPDQLNLEESTSVMYRLMKVPEVQEIILTGVVGNDANTFSIMTMLKQSHLRLFEHVQENNSKNFLSFSRDPKQAVLYAALSFLPANYALVKTNLPPVFTIPGLQAELDPDPWNEYHNLYVEQQRQNKLDDKTKYIMPVNAITLAQEGQEIDMLINNSTGTCDFRPTSTEMLLQINYIWGGFKNYAYLNEPAPELMEKKAQRDWAIEVYCPTDMTNYHRMIQAGRDKGLIPPHSRPITVDDATVIFPILNSVFPANTNILHHHVHILKYLPQNLEIGSPLVGIFIQKEHEKFRQQHSFFNHNGCKGKHDYYIEARSPLNMRPKNNE